VGPRTVLDAVVKRKIPNPRWQSNPRTPVAYSPALYRLSNHGSTHHRIKVKNYYIYIYRGEIGSWVRCLFTYLYNKSLIPVYSLATYKNEGEV
jgi:hypothetical protein